MMMADEQLLDSSAEALLRLGDNDDLTVFQQHVETAVQAIGAHEGTVKVVEAERRVRELAEDASKNAGDRLQILLDFLSQQRKSIESDLA